MFFKFDGFTNRLGRATPLIATNPGALTPSAKEPFKETEFNFESSKVRPVKLEVDVRYTHEGGGHSAAGGHGAHSEPLGVIPASEGYARVANLQKLWLANDGLLVWQKRGVRDTGLYYATLAGCAAGALYGVYLIVCMSFPKKAQD